MDTRKFLPTAEMQADFEIYRNLKTADEKEAFQKKRKAAFDNKSEDEQTAYIQASNASVRAIGERVEELIGIVELGEVAKIVSVSYIAQKYFGKTRHWLYQRINGSIVNGKPAKFTDVERERLKAALQDIGNIIQNTSLRIA
jgi:hypothetical protein